MNGCSEEGCIRPARARGLCLPHYERLRRAGLPPLPSDLERFWSKVDRSGGPDACWHWTGNKTTGGYGYTQFQKRPTRTHRLAFTLTRSDPCGLMVCHHCDNPPCCNPAHLFLGTATANNRDRHVKGRSAGPTHERHGARKLSLSDYAEIRRLVDAGRPQKDLAREFGVSDSQLSRIVKGVSSGSGQA